MPYPKTGRKLVKKQMQMSNGLGAVNSVAASIFNKPSQAARKPAAHVSNVKEAKYENSNEKIIN